MTLADRVVVMNGGKIEQLESNRERCSVFPQPAGTCPYWLGLFDAITVTGVSR